MLSSFLERILIMTSPTFSSLCHLRKLLSTKKVSYQGFKSLSTSLSMSQEHKNMPQASFFPIMKTTMLPKDTYKGKIVFISGGGTGLGKGMAKKFSDLGATVVISSRRMNVLEDAAKGTEAFIYIVIYCAVLLISYQTFD